VPIRCFRFINSLLYAHFFAPVNNNIRGSIALRIRPISPYRICTATKNKVRFDVSKEAEVLKALKIFVVLKIPYRRCCFMHVVEDPLDAVTI
jgi:hypothetical protein